jgi:hypothetical protein
MSELFTFDFPIKEYEKILRKRLKEELQKVVDKMKQRVSLGTSPATPGAWVGKINANIKLTPKGGWGAIVFDLGLQDGTPEQALWMAYIYNFGSGQYGQNGLIVSQPAYYNVDTDSMEKGRDYYREYPQFGKQKNAWFTDTVNQELMGGGFQSMLDRVNDGIIEELLSSGKWKIEGHEVKVTIKI